MSSGYSVNTATHEAMDIRDFSNVSRILKSMDPDLVIHTAAFTDVDGCEKDRKKAYEVNVLGTRNIVHACKENHLKLIFFSTDYIFDGEEGYYREEDKANPLNSYGKTKLQAEEEIVKSGIEYIIERVSVLYGYNDSGDKLTFARWVIKSLKEGKNISVVTDQLSCPTLIDNIAHATLTLIEKEEEGVFHVTGSECLSRFDFARTIADTFNLDGSLISPVATEALTQTATRPKNSCLSTEKINKLGIQMSDTKNGLAFMKRCMQETPLNTYLKDNNSKVSF